MDLFLLIFACFCFICIRIYSGKKSGVLYTAMRQRGNNHNKVNINPLLKQSYDNIHFIETPFWYCVYLGFTSILIYAFNQVDKNPLYTNVTAAILISYGCSAVSGVFYQGYINLGNTDEKGVPLKFIDINEKRYMELAFPFLNITVKVNRFWRGRFRIISSILG